MGRVIAYFSKGVCWRIAASNRLARPTQPGATSEICTGARLLARFGTVEQTVVADDQGFFAAWLMPDTPLPHDRLWHTVELMLLDPQPAEPTQIRAIGR